MSTRRRARQQYEFTDRLSAREAPRYGQIPPTQQPAPHDLAAGEGVATVLGGRTQPLAPDVPHGVRGEGATPANTERGDA